MQGRANAALLLLARDMDAEFVEPADEKSYAAVRGRTHGCTFEVLIGPRDGTQSPPVLVIVRHFSNQATASLDGEGLHLPDLDPAAMRAAIEQACYSFSTQS